MTYSASCQLCCSTYHILGVSTTKTCRAGSSEMVVCVGSKVMIYLSTHKCFFSVTAFSFFHYCVLVYWRVSPILNVSSYFIYIYLPCFVISILFIFYILPLLSCFKLCPESLLITRALRISCLLTFRSHLPKVLGRDSVKWILSKGFCRRCSS